MSIKEASAALDRCDATLVELAARCCEPGRSPSMDALARTIASARAGLDRLTDGSADHLVEVLEDAGAQIGRLQVGCCAPDRLPLYAEILDGLTSTQLAVNEALGRGH